MNKTELLSLKIHKCIKQKIRMTSNPIAQRHQLLPIRYIPSKEF